MNYYVQVRRGRNFVTAEFVAGCESPEIARLIVDTLLDRPFCADPHNPEAVRLDASWRRTLRRVRDEMEGLCG